MIVKVKNTLADIAPFSYLSVGTNSGAGTIPVKNINQFSASWAVQIGETGQEQSELLVLSASTPSGTSLVATGTARFPHAADTRIFATKFDQVVFKRSTTGTAGTAAAFATVSLTPDSFYTQHDDTSGAAGYAYKAAFRNSVTTDVSSDSDWLTVDGYSFYSLAKIRERVRGKIFNSTFIQDSQINDWVNEWKERMDNAIIDINKDYALGTTVVSFAGTAELGTISANDFKDIRRVWFTQNGTDYFSATKMSINEYEPNQVFNETHPYFYMYGDNIIGRKPNASSGTAVITYYKSSSILSSDTDELPYNQHNYTKSYVDYCLAQAYQIDQKDRQAREFNASALNELEKFKNEQGGRLKTGSTFIRVDEALSADDGEWF